MQPCHPFTILHDYSYRLAIRDTFSPIHCGGKLYQQYLVDAYAKMEGNRLNFIRTKQEELRADQYKGLMDHLMNQAEDNLKSGKVIILPSSYKDGHRAMHQGYQDAMSIVAKHAYNDKVPISADSAYWGGGGVCSSDKCLHMLILPAGVVTGGWSTSGPPTR